MALAERYEQVEAHSRAEWRSWLERNHATSPGVWLVYYKQGSGKPSVSYEEAVEEALCFGWIDSTVNAIDEERYRQIITPRKRGSVWSRPNKERVERLIAEGRMTPFGLAVIEAAKADGSWSALDDVEALVVPPDLAEALDSVPEARERFEAFSDSVKKTTLYFVKSAKRPETRARRIAETVGLAARGLRVMDYSAAERARILGEAPGAPTVTSADAEDGSGR